MVSRGLVFNPMSGMFSFCKEYMYHFILANSLICLKCTHAWWGSLDTQFWKSLFIEKPCPGFVFLWMRYTVIHSVSTWLTTKPKWKHPGDICNIWSNCLFKEKKKDVIYVLLTYFDRQNQSLARIKNVAVELHFDKSAGLHWMTNRPSLNN